MMDFIDLKIFFGKAYDNLTNDECVHLFMSIWKHNNATLKDAVDLCLFMYSLCVEDSYHFAAADWLRIIGKITKDRAALCINTSPNDIVCE